MTTRPPCLELLAPAKNADFGIDAITHGADAVYIGGPSFGARSEAGNSIADIERLARHAHRFNARVLVALNTIVDDRELAQARDIAWQSWNAGADALIVQDMGLLECDLPPIALHASTQCDIRTPEKARFLDAVGFSQMVLARELSLAQIAAIAAQTTATLEFFVHGALCVSYSGQCYLSHAQTGRSANRGECSQACRLPYTVADGQGTVLLERKHVLSLKDNNQTDNLAALIDAGIRSFKIEGRLKDLSYVKNVTAHYRQRLDALLEQQPALRRASSGRSTFQFTPNPDKTFHRGATDYFVTGRQIDIGAFDSPKFAGEAIGEIARLGRKEFDLATKITLNNGDGLSFFTADGELTGLRVNIAEPIDGGFRLSPSLTDGRLPAGLAVGTKIFRNHDQVFERALEKKSAERRIPLQIRLDESADGLVLGLTDDRGVSATATITQPLEPARDGEQALAGLREGLAKLGNTLYTADTITLDIATPRFIPASLLNALRREAVEALDAARAAAYRRPERVAAQIPPAPYPEAALSYLGNVFNAGARAFYEKHGVTRIEPAYECGEETGEVSLMVTKHCLRFSLTLCPKQVKGIRPEPLQLIHGKDRLMLRFDCRACEMHVLGRLKPVRR
ncbi:peptidase U32 family protein [Propionivibrio dicarboxylicus]|uniref:Putative protease n=1 Tax=Propionivibrio dicarboxylicus TaxID=83767 RepID=A0A1G7Y5Q1_9RHOO|nr:U32 family peptidase [Propionivibrio dicarboxylicus]SDG91697.1 putative protease [Propionivibrio dicarboxylicus]